MIVADYASEYHLSLVAGDVSFHEFRVLLRGLMSIDCRTTRRILAINKGEV